MKKIKSRLLGRKEGTSDKLITYVKDRAGHDLRYAIDSTKLKNELQKLRLGRVVVENTGNIGKNYRKHDEIGTPICITIDFDTLEKNTVTIRNRDTMAQQQLDIGSVPDYFKNLLIS